MWKTLPLALWLVATAGYATECADLFQPPQRKLHSDEMLDLCALTAGKPVLVVNTASHCGFTPQFQQLQALYERYGPRGLVVIGVPSDDFFQEADEEKDTAQICYINYGVTFPMLATSAVRGSDALPLFKTLADRSDTAPKWNFFKYLVTTDGRVVHAWSSTTTPDDPEVISAIEALLPPPQTSP